MASSGVHKPTNWDAPHASHLQVAHSRLQCGSGTSRQRAAKGAAHRCQHVEQVSLHLQRSDRVGWEGQNNRQR